jgi:hypothetical protein
MIDDVGQHRLLGLVHEVGGARTVLAHAHVEGAVVAEREAALRRIELHRRDADIEHDMIRLRLARIPQEGVEIAEPAGHQLETSPGGSNQGLTRGDRGRIAVDGENPQGRIALQQRAGVAAGTERAVDGEAAFGLQGHRHLVEQDGDVRWGRAEFRCRIRHRRRGTPPVHAGLGAAARPVAGWRRGPEIRTRMRLKRLMVPWAGPHGGGTRDGNGTGCGVRKTPRTDGPCPETGCARRSDTRR